MFLVERSSCLHSVDTSSYPSSYSTSFHRFHPRTYPRVLRYDANDDHHRFKTLYMPGILVKVVKRECVCSAVIPNLLSGAKAALDASRPAFAFSMLSHPDEARNALALPLPRLGGWSISPSDQPYVPATQPSGAVHPLMDSSQAAENSAWLTDVGAKMMVCSVTGASATGVKSLAKTKVLRWVLIAGLEVSTRASMSALNLFPSGESYAAATASKDSHSV